jgi:tetratricopeptide (TPR) repeat protein
MLVGLLPETAFSQTKLGKVTYYEGKVKVGKSGSLSDVKLNAIIYDDYYIETGKESLLEITWTSGKKSTVLSNKKTEAEKVFENSSKNLKDKTGGVTKNFDEKFKLSLDKKKQEIGGIRRGEEQDVQEVSSDDTLGFQKKLLADLDYAFEFYNYADFLKAYQQFEKFNSTYLENPYKKEVIFAMANCLLELEDYEGAEELFKVIIDQYPEDPLSEDAEKILDEF